MQNKWTATGDLGLAGGLCNDDVPNNTASCDDNGAQFGLLSYCIESPVALFGGIKQDVCLEYTDEVTIIDTNVTMDGYTRFEDFGLEDRAGLSFAMTFFAIGTAGLADLYSEKLFVCCVL